MSQATIQYFIPAVVFSLHCCKRSHFQSPVFPLSETWILLPYPAYTAPQWIEACYVCPWVCSPHTAFKLKTPGYHSNCGQIHSIKIYRTITGRQTTAWITNTCHIFSFVLFIPDICLPITN